MSEANEVMVLDNLNPVTLFEKETLETVLKQVEAKVKALPSDLTTKKGREDIASTAYKVSKTKTFLDKMAKEYQTELEKCIEPVKAGRKRIAEFCDKLRDDVRQPLTEWENKEKSRVENIQRQLSIIVGYGQLPFGATTEVIRARIEQLKTMPEFKWEEFQAQFEACVSAASGLLENALAERIKYEADQEELQKLRAAAKPEAPEVKATSGVTLGRTTDVSPVGKAILDGAPVDDTERKRQINRSVMESLKAAAPGLSDDQAKAILTAIVKKQILNVTITY